MTFVVTVITANVNRRTFDRLAINLNHQTLTKIYSHYLGLAYVQIRYGHFSGAVLKLQIHILFTAYYKGGFIGISNNSGLFLGNWHTIIIPFTCTNPTKRNQPCLMLLLVFNQLQFLLLIQTIEPVALHTKHNSDLSNI